MYVAQPIQWTDRGVVMLDQRRLPAEEISYTYTDYREVAKAIREMVIRGAPAIGVAAAMGAALGVLHSSAQSVDALLLEFRKSATRCQNQSYSRGSLLGPQRMKRRFAELTSQTSDLAKLGKAWSRKPSKPSREEQPTTIGRFGANSCPATARHDPVQRRRSPPAASAAPSASSASPLNREETHVLVPETRPYLQGARLTAWELHKGGIPLTLITDNMVGHFLKTEKVSAIVTGADRIAANGDTANKIGTYQIAVLAKENNVSFYIAAPVSTFDLSIPTAITFPSSVPPPVSHLRTSASLRRPCRASTFASHPPLYRRHLHRTQRRPPLHRISAPCLRSSICRHR
jgi:methylthioribose-1-phosphate isomerase